MLYFYIASEFELRWFSPKCEVPLCGHGTLATAYVIFYILGVQIIFKTTF